MSHTEYDTFVATRRQTLGLVAGLSQVQADHRPDTETWSVGEVLDHLTRIDRIFRKDFEELIERGRSGTPALLIRSLSDFDVSLPFVPDALTPLFDLPLAFLGFALPRPVRQVVARNRAVPVKSPDIIQPIAGRPIVDLRSELEDMILFVEDLLARHPEIPLDQLYYYNPLTAGTDFPGLLSFTASHESRHQDQIRDILASGGFSAIESTEVISAAVGGREGGNQIEGFAVRVSNAALDDLNTRLDSIRYPDQLEDGRPWEDGTDLHYLKQLMDYWRYVFDWRRQEIQLNLFDQFVTEIDGLQLHFIHHRSKEPRARPLVLIHSWPSSVFEFFRILEPLLDPTSHGGRAEDAFHVICPSIPGFAWSQGPRQHGFTVRHVARVIAGLMARLGYSSYFAAGGDIGSMVCSFLASDDTAHCRGILMTLLPSIPPPGLDEPLAGLTPEEQLDLEHSKLFTDTGAGYLAIQSTRPQSLGYGLNDSPAGLAAWITEKFRDWMDNQGVVENQITKDELLTNIAIYWFTKSITSSIRIYEANKNAGLFGWPEHKIELPTACVIGPYELSKPPRRWVEFKYNVQRWTRLKSGGHFLAIEEPEALTDEIRAFFHDLS